MGEETNMPAVGETWHSDTYASHWGTLLVLRTGVTLGGNTDRVECRGGVGEIVKPGSVGLFRRSDLTRRIHPAPSADDGEAKEWKVGDRAWHTEANQECVLVERNPAASARAWFASFERNGATAPRVPVLEMFLRRLDATPSVPLPGGASWAQPPDSRRFSVSGDEPAATPTPKYVIRAVTDPYALHRFTNDDATVAAKMNERDARLAKRARFTADTLRDLGRPLLKLGGRFGKKVAMTHPATWPEADERDP